MDLGHRVRDLRNAQHLSQIELASRAGVARNTLNRIENGHLMPTAPVIEHLAEALGVAPGALFEELALTGPKGGAPDPGPPSSAEDYDEVLIPRSPLTSEAFRGVRELLVDYEDRKEYLSLSIEDGYVEAGLKQREETASPRLRPEDDEIAFPEGAVEEVIRLHKQGKLGKDDARKAVAKLTDLALEDATEEIEEYMAEMAARVKEAPHGDRPK